MRDPAFDPEFCEECGAELEHDIDYEGRGVATCPKCTEEPMTVDEALDQAVAELKAEDPEKVFEALRMICDEFGWDLQKRDPGPECDLEGGWCATHSAWIDEHDWRNAALMAAPISAWPEEKIRQSTAELRDLNSKLSKDEIKESYRHLALVRRVP